MRGLLEAVVPRYPDLSGVGRSIVITNSERNVAACPLRHWYRYVLGLDTPTEKVTAAGFGTGFHSVMETVFGAAKEADEVPTEDVAREAVESVVEGWSSLVGETYDSDQFESDSDRLREVVSAWWRGFDLERFLGEFEVVDVERAFVAPIVNPETGTPLRASMRIVEALDESGSPILRLARPGDEGWRRVQWPWLFAGRVDLVVASRRTGALWLLDHKTTTRPDGLASTLSTDPQAPSYAWTVEQSTGRRVAGFIWNIVDSARPGDPRILKSGRLSLAARQTVPSWKIEDYLAARNAETGETTSEDESEFVAAQRARVDGRWSVFEQYGLRREDIEIAGREIHADAVRLAGLYRSGLVDDRRALATTHPRVPVCKASGAFCSYRGPCSSDGELARLAYESRPAREWRRPTSSSSLDSTTSAEATSATTSTAGDLGW